MDLNSECLREGLKYICGVWEPEFIVNAFSSDLVHVPATEFKSDDGNSFAQMKFDFREDHTVVMKTDKREETGVWEQTDLFRYHYTFTDFLKIPDGAFKKNAETLDVVDDRLCFTIGFLTVGMKKISDGVITPLVAGDIGEAESSDEDKRAAEIVGTYMVYQCFTFVGGNMGMFTREEVKKDLDPKLKNGEIDEDEYNESFTLFDARIEFTPDHKVIEWVKLPAGVKEEEISEALKSGELKAVRDGYMSTSEPREWKCVKGIYYYDTKETREAAGEKISSWDELKTGDDGLMEYMSGMVTLKKDA